VVMILLFVSALEAGVFQIEIEEVVKEAVCVDGNRIE
jgi:hypothetical protein